MVGVSLEGVAIPADVLDVSAGLIAGALHVAVVDGGPGARF